jgi:hypothetical protein
LKHCPILKRVLIITLVLILKPAQRCLLLPGSLLIGSRTFLSVKIGFLLRHRIYPCMKIEPSGLNPQWGLLTVRSKHFRLELEGWLARTKWRISALTSSLIMRSRVKSWSKSQN